MNFLQQASFDFVDRTERCIEQRLKEHIYDRA